MAANGTGLLGWKAAHVDASDADAVEDSISPSHPPKQQRKGNPRGKQGTLPKGHGSQYPPGGFDAFDFASQV